MNEKKSPMRQVWTNAFGEKPLYTRYIWTADDHTPDILDTAPQHQKDAALLIAKFELARIRANNRRT
jgi:hypothetical protein